MKCSHLAALLAGLVPALTLAADSNAFNPDIALVLSGIYSDIQHNPDGYTIPGFTLPDGSGPGTRGFGLGESELAIYANIDPDWYGMFTYSMHMDNTAEVENAFVQTTSLGHGLTVKGGRFYSGIGYLNEQHSHTWDFVDVPLAYQVFLGSQLKDDGIEVRWLAPTDMYTEFGTEWMNGRNFPAGGSGNSGKGTYTAFVHIGDDVGFSNSWRGGLSYVHTDSVDRTTCIDAGCSARDSFTGNSRTLLADFVWKWAPNGNVYDRNFKLQAEYLHQTDGGDFTPAGGSVLPLERKADGWYVQGVYQFVHGWRVGLRYDQLKADNPGTAFAGTSLDPQDHTPSRDSIMVDYTNSEFSRIRLQYNHDDAGPVADNQWYLQYIMSLGAHPAHIF